MRRILSIDCGGIRGTFPAAFFAALEDVLECPIHEDFDLIAGTSTGGIIAIALAMGLPAKDILELYEKRGPEIFSQTHTGMRGLAESVIRKVKWATWGPKYNAKELERALTDIFGDKKIGDAKTRLMIPPSHQSDGGS